jgi:hypothetical protein
MLVCVMLVGLMLSGCIYVKLGSRPAPSFDERMEELEQRERELNERAEQLEQYEIELNERDEEDEDF